MRVRRIVTLFIALGLFAAMTACGDDDAASAPADESTSDTASSDTASPGDESDAEVETEDIKVATYGIAAGVAFVYVAETEGFFEEENLDVEIIPGAANVLNLVVSGGADLGFLGAGGALSTAADGQDLDLIYAFTTAFSAGSLAGVAGVSAPEDCTRVGSLSVGSSTYGAAAMYKDAFDLDYDIVPLADFPTINAALASGDMNCASGPALAFRNLVEEQGGSLLIDDRDFDLFDEVGVDPNVPDGTLFGESGNLQERRDAIVRYLRATNKAYEFILDSSDEEVAASLKEHPDFADFEVESLAADIADARPHFFPKDNPGFIQEGLWENALGYFRSFGLENIDPSADVYAFDERVDNSYLEEALNG